MSKKIQETTCPFCNLGCKMGFEVKNGEIRRVDYIKDSFTKGRLCPKGNASAALVTHRKRLYHAILNGEISSVSKGIEYLKQRIANFKSEEVLFAYDETLTNEEIALLVAGLKEAGYENLAYAVPGPQTAFLYGKIPPLKLDKLENADYAFIIGDPYSQNSVISGFLAEAKGERRDFRYIVLDSFKTNTGNFAHNFIKIRAGYEGLFIYGLHKYITEKKADISQIAEFLTIDASLFETVAATIRNKQGVLIYAPSKARSFDNLLTHGSAVMLADALKGMTYLPLGNRPPAYASKPFFSYLPMIMGGRIKALVSFGALFPWDYTQLKPVLRKLDFVSAGSFFIPDDKLAMDIVFPMIRVLEKEGSIQTLFGQAKLIPFTSPVSGTISAGDLASKLIPTSSAVKRLVGFHPAFDKETIDKRAKNLMSSASKRPKGMTYLLIAEEPAIGFRSVFQEDNYIKLSANDAESLGINNGDILGVQTSHGDTELVAKVFQTLPQGLMIVSANYRNSTEMFVLDTDEETGEAILKPVWSKVWKK